MRAGNVVERERARRRVDEIKRALGQRGDVWWTDGAPDYNRHMARNTPYADWYASLARCQHYVERRFLTATPRRPEPSRAMVEGSGVTVALDANVTGTVLVKLSSSVKVAE